MIRRQPTWYLALIALLTIGLDQWTKHLIASALTLHKSWTPPALDWLSPFITITHVHNTGAAFGSFPAGGPIFATIGIVVAIAIIYYFHQLPAGQWWVRTALGLQLGGAVGNLIDRFRQGYVVDFIDCGLWPVFNLADSAIVVGVAILVVVMYLEDRRAAKDRREYIPEDSPAPGVESDAVSS